MEDENIPAYQMWKVITETFSALLNSDSDEKIKLLINILRDSGYSQILLFSPEEIYPKTFYESTAKKYKAFSIWLLGRFFYLLSQDKHIRIHDLIIDAQKRILDCIQLNSSNQEIILEYIKLLKDLKKYFLNGCKEKISLKTFLPADYEGLENTLDFSPLFIEISSEKKCNYLIGVSLKIIKQFIVANIELQNYGIYMVELFEIYDFIIEKCSLDLKLNILEVFANVVAGSDEFPTKIKYILLNIFYKYEQMISIIFDCHRLKNDILETFQNLSIRILSSKLFKSNERISFICKDILLKTINKNVHISDELLNICQAHVESNFYLNVTSVKLLKKPIINEILNYVLIYKQNTSIKLNEDASSLWWNYIKNFNEKWETIVCNESCCLKNFLEDTYLLAELGVSIKITFCNNKNIIFENLDFMLKSFLSKIYNHICNCNSLVEYEKFSSIIVCLSFLCETHKPFINDVCLYLLPYPILKRKIYKDSDELLSKLLSCTKETEIRIMLKKLVFYMDQMEINENICYVMTCKYLSVMCRPLNQLNEDVLLKWFKSIFQEVSVPEITLIIPNIANILSKIENIWRFCDILQLLFATNEEQILEPLSVVVLDCVIILCTNYNKIYELKDGEIKIFYKISHNTSDQNLQEHPKIKSKPSFMKSLIKLILKMLGLENATLKVNSLKALGILSRYENLFYKIPTILWIKLLTNDNVEVKQAFPHFIYDVLNNLQFNVNATASEKNEIIDNVFVYFNAEIKNSLKKENENLQELIMNCIVKLSKIKNSCISLKVIKILLHFIVVPKSKQTLLAIDTLNNFSSIYNINLNKLFSKYKLELCKDIANLCSSNYCKYQYNISMTLERLPYVFRYAGCTDFVVKETRHLLPFFVSLVVKIPSITKLIDEIAILNEVETSELLASRYGYIYLHIFLNEDEDNQKCLRFVEKNSALDGPSLRKRNFMVIINELLLNFHEKRNRVTAALENLAKEDADSKAQTVPDFLQPRFLGVLQYFDLKLMSPQYEKQKVLLSLAEILQYMGPKRITPLRFKILAMLRTALGSNIKDAPDLNCDVWGAFINSCDIESLGPQLAVIIVSLLPLIEVNKPKISKIFELLIVRNESVLKEYIPDLFFLLENENIDYKYLNVIKKYLIPIQEDSFKEHLKYFIKYLMYDIVEVKIYALKYVKRLLEKNRKELNEMILGYNGIEPVVVEYLELLTLGCRELDPTLRLLCGECIGAFGAIEPSHLPRKCNNEDESFNFFITDNSFIVSSLMELTQALQAEKNTQNMDRYSVAIQETLKTYNISNDKNSSNYSSWEVFPAPLQELMTPLLSSKYTIAQNIDTIDVFPIYGSNLGSNFQSWLYSFTVWLISSIKSSEQKLLVMYLPSMKQDHKILMHFLPNILLHSLLEENRNQHRIFDEFMAVILSQNNTTIPQKNLTERNIFVEYNSQSNQQELSDQSNNENFVKVVFVLLDYLEKWLREWIWVKGCAGREDTNYKRIKQFCSRFCKLQIAKCNFDCGEYARALMYLEDYMNMNKSDYEKNLSLLAEIYYRLDEPDGVGGTAAVRQNEPSLDQRILALEVMGKLSDAVSCNERRELPLSLPSIQRLLKCYLDLNNVNTALNIAQGIMTDRPEYTTWMLEAQAEPLWRLGRYDDLKKLINNEHIQGSELWSVQVGKAFLHFREDNQKGFKKQIDLLKMAQIDNLRAASLTEGAYQHGYFYISRLHALTELEQVQELLQKIFLYANDTSQCYKFILELKEEWDLRIKVVQQSLHIIEPILCLRRVVIEQAKELVVKKNIDGTNLFNTLLGESWIKSAEISCSTQGFQQAYTYILKAEEYSPTNLFITKAELHWVRGEHEQALTTLKRGLQKYLPFPIKDSPLTKLNTDERKLCAKAQLLIATYNDTICNVDKDVNIQNYKTSIEIYKECEESLVFLAQYYDRIFEKLSAVEKDTKGTDLQIHMINNFLKSLQYGTKYVYQSLPRLLSIWFEYGTRILDVSLSAIKEERKTNLLKMTRLIDSFLERLPLYIFLTAFSQIVSRICHPQKEVYILLKQIITKLILKYPQQTFWMIIPILKSSYAVRSKKCTEILSDSRFKNPFFIKLLGDFTKLAEKLIELCNKNINESIQSVSINSILRSLPRLITKEDFSPIMIPTEKFRKLVLPNSDGVNLNHNPFPNRYVHIVNLEDQMTILTSLQRPRKITFRGSDGKCYIQMLKPKDDLRKDFRLMEFNDIVNQMLSREPETRQRRLFIRLYSVVPLNEECGLIEWIPNLVGLRPVVMNIYKQGGLGMRNKDLKDALKGSDPLEVKRASFLNKVLPKYPPVLGQWFRKNFSDPQSWFTARTAYIRTVAVMSMVGYIFGLGDRHGENILLDSTSGDAIHVDFNCLFNKGEQFDFPERVPFRLTQNMVDAMGPLGIEGVYRKSCVCTLKVLRMHINTLMSIVTPFVYDPLVSWPRNATGNPNAQNAEKTNELALDHIKDIQQRLEGKVRTKSRNFSIPLSVEGQTNILIEEATNVNNLCQMYIGWGPHL